MEKLIILDDVEAATEEELTEAINHNEKVNVELKEAIREIEKATTKPKEKPKQVRFSIQNKQEELPIEDEEDPFESEIEFYVTKLKYLTIDQLDEYFVKSLPSRLHYEYERILRRLQLELLKECKDIDEFIASEQEINAEDLESFKEEAVLNKEMIARISQELAKKDQSEEDKKEPPQNNFVLVPTPGGNIRVLEDIDSIDISQYHQLDQLLTSIKDGTFKCVKQLKGPLSGFSEVRDIPNGGRIIFTRLNCDTYAIVTAFIKKNQNSNGYQKGLENQLHKYKGIEDFLKANLDNPKFMEQNKLYVKKLEATLNPAAEEKKNPKILQLAQGGTING